MWNWLSCHDRWLIMTMLALSCAVWMAGCTRPYYRRRADREANYLVQEKSVGTPWEVPRAYTIQPDERSRFFDPTDPDHPTLPPAGPWLYRYKLPTFGRAPAAGAESLPATTSQQGRGQGELPTPPAPPAPPLSLVPRRPWVPPGQSDVQVQLVGFQQPAPADEVVPFEDVIESATEAGPEIKGHRSQPIKESYWDAVPSQCLARMLEFESVHNEYADTYGGQPPDTARARAPYLSLQDLFKLALINSREYQRQKEQLYFAALDLSLQRYAYATRLTSRQGSFDATYTHSRVNGFTVNRLNMPSSLHGDKLLATGGRIVTDFANRILLTFNGPSGFAADVSTDLLLSITQRVFQRDIVLESLIQSERDVVYAARSFTRFRKQFFLTVANSYYRLLRTYRGVEIDAQNYFAQVRNFQQAEEEVASGISTAPNPIGVNQFEQGVLRARSTLIRSCNVLEQSLDNLKITLGLPTETRINIDLFELDQLTLRDRVEVNQEQARRWLVRLELMRKKASAENHADILTADYSLAERLITWLNGRAQLMPDTAEHRDLYEQRAQFFLDAARLEALAAREALKRMQQADPPKERILIYQRQVDLIESQLELVDRQGKLGFNLRVPSDKLARPWQEMHQLEDDFDALRETYNAALESKDDQAIVDLIDRATAILARLDTLAQNLDDFLFRKQVLSVDLNTTLVKTDALIRQTKDLFAKSGQGLPPMNITADQAMVTALVQRLDLMNERGGLADNWRAIKIAADELRSFVTLSASQRLSNEKNRPFHLSTRTAQTSVGLSTDLPLNRRIERNVYRRALINYNFGLRNLMRFEDDIKLNIRRQLRNLEQARDQYPISVAQAALAQEQVLSTRLQLILGLSGVRPPDLVDAFSDSRQALGSVADARIGYIIERAFFALELEAIMLDDNGFWADISNERYQPKVNTAYPWNAGSAYGGFPQFLKTSREMRRMLNYPPPGANPAELPAGIEPEQPAAAGPRAAPTPAIGEPGSQ